MCRNLTYEVVGQRRILKATREARPTKQNDHVEGNLQSNEDQDIEDSGEASGGLRV
jgi:hypothetical protein